MVHRNMSKGPGLSRRCGRAPAHLPGQVGRQLCGAQDSGAATTEEIRLCGRKWMIGPCGPLFIFSSSL